MGNCQDQFQNVDEHEYRSYNEAHKPTVLIDRTHKSVKPSKYQSNVGYLLNKQSEEKFDNERMYKSMALQKNRKIDRKARDQEQFVEPGKLTELDLTFYHTLGLPEYVYRKKTDDIMHSKIGYRNDHQVYIQDSEDRVGVVYVGQRNSEGLFHGNGVLMANTVQYIGQFFAGARHAHGRQIYSTEVYEGEFKIDIRKGKGIRYTKDYVDEGIYDKMIVKGCRTFYNGNVYYGEFYLNQMHGKGRSSEECQWSFRDENNHLFYDGEIQFRNGQLISAQRVSKFSNEGFQSGREEEMQLIGRFEDGKIIPLKSGVLHEKESENDESDKQSTALEEKVRAWG